MECRLLNKPTVDKRMTSNMTWKKFITDEDGATLVEYVLLVALIGVVAITAMRFLGGTASNKLNGVSANVANSN
jgi:Flp pilus assembly pilin Flp